MRLVSVFCLCLFFYSLPICAQSNALKLQSDSNALKNFYFAGLRDKLTENYESAHQNFKKALAVDTKNDAVLFEMAIVNYAQNQPLDAEVNLKTAIQNNSNNVWYYRFLAEIYKKQDRISDLPSVFNDIIRLEPQNQNVYLDRCKAWQLMGDEEQVKRGFEEIEQKFGNSEALRNAKNSALADNQLEKSNTITDNSYQSNELNKVLALCDQLVKQNKAEEAIVALQKAKQLTSNSYPLATALANCYLKTQKWELAIAELKFAFQQSAMSNEEKVSYLSVLGHQFQHPNLETPIFELLQIALDMDSKSPVLLVLAGDFYFHVHDFPKALQFYEEALKQNYQSVAIWEKRIYVCLASKDNKQAIKIAEESLTFYPNHANLYYLYALALHHNHQKNEALEYLKMCRDLIGDDKQMAAKLFLLQAEMAIEDHKLDQATEYFEKALALDEHNTDILNSYAYYIAISDLNINQAEKLILKAIDIDSESASFADTYAFILVKKGNYVLAKKWIEKALAIHENLSYVEHYGDILFLNGETAQALVQWKKANQEGNKSEKLNRKINEEKYFK
ncbi:MAG: hypothetical protein K2Q03_07030 [Sphingobacteriaceae bacterium]|nr:hypothetical protein [Sphingobacteriaceae bacterium]